MFLIIDRTFWRPQLQLDWAGMEPNGASNVAPSAAASATDLILQQRTGAYSSAQATVQQAVQKGDGSLFSQVTSNPLFTAVCDPFSMTVGVARDFDY